MESNPAKARYHWRPARAWLCLIVYWLLSLGGAGVLAKSGMPSSQEFGYVIFIMLVLVSACMLTERGEWKLWRRVLWVPGSWLLHASLCASVIGFIGAMFAGRSEFEARATSFFGSLPIVLISMRRSRLFVTAEEPLQNSETKVLRDAA